MSEKRSRRKFLQDSTIAAAGALVAPQAASALAAPQAGGNARTEYQRGSVGIEKKNQVATIFIDQASPPGANHHWELGEVFSELRGDNSIRVIVLTWPEGKPDYSSDQYSAADPGDNLASRWRTFTGLVRCHEAMLAIEKPIVCRVHRDTVGFQSNLIFASDMIVAREDVVIGDHHMAPVVFNGKVIRVSPYVVPGDGGAAWIPLYMSPAKAKEYLMLSKPYTAKELAQMGVINYAVPAAQLDKVVNDIVEQLLQRSAYALAWTKRVINAHYVERVTSSLNAAAAYEMVNFLQMEKTGNKILKTLE